MRNSEDIYLREPNPLVVEFSELKFLDATRGLEIKTSLYPLLFRELGNESFAAILSSLCRDSTLRARELPLPAPSCPKWELSPGVSLSPLPEGGLSAGR